MYRPANSISEITSIPFSLSPTIIGNLSGIPGLFTTKSAVKIRSSECCPSSYSTPNSSNTRLYLSANFPLSDKKTSYPNFFPNLAAPAPLSPPPKITKRFIILDFKFLLIVSSTSQSLSPPTQFPRSRTGSRSSVPEYPSFGNGDVTGTSGISVVPPRTFSLYI